MNELESEVKLNASAITKLEIQIANQSSGSDKSQNYTPDIHNNRNHGMEDEMEERHKRRTNLKLTNIIESKETNPQSRMEHDINEVLKISSILGGDLTHSDILTCFRVGKPVTHKPRSLIVRFSNEVERSKFLGKANEFMRLNRSSREQLGGTIISPDLTKKQQSKLSCLYDEAKAKNESETDPQVRWVVSGPRELPHLKKLKSFKDQCTPIPPRS